MKSKTSCSNNNNKEAIPYIGKKYLCEYHAYQQYQEGKQVKGGGMAVKCEDGECDESSCYHIDIVRSPIKHV